MVERVRGFIDDCFAKAAVHDNFLDADKGGFTRTEYDLLRAPGSERWRLIRAALKTGGRLSQGIRLGWRTGFDSGLTLDYIYENKPRGWTPIGKIVDRCYLNAVGWRGIRARRMILGRMLESTIRRAHADGRTVHILDIASGPGRYLLENMRRLREIPMSATLRDYKPANLEAARKLARELDLRNAQIVYGDAFDRSSLAAHSPQPTIAIASGLFELIPENAPVLESLCGIADAMEPGGYLLYTNQPWHPQMEFIARALINREGRPWVMRRRTQAEMDALVREAGFEKIEQDIDPFGIFTVSLAVRVRA